MNSKIIGMADATHYLVVFSHDQSSSNKEIKAFDSIANAKQFLRDHHFDTTVIEYQSAYDEMCGTQTATPYVEHITL